MKIKTKQYAEILDESLAHHGADKDAVLSDFIALLKKDGKLSKINDILREFESLWNKRHDIVDVIVETADKDDVLVPKTIHGKHVNLVIKENKKLIGGQVIRIGDNIIDNSVISKINALKI